MLTIVSICDYPLDDNINGMVFYPTEMLHHIKSNYENIHILESSVIPTDYFNRNKLFEHKYISLHKFVDLKDIQNDSVLLLNTESYLQLLMSHYEVLERSKCIWFFNSFNIENAFMNQLLINHQMLSRYLKIQYKSFLLHEQGFENGATKNNFLFPQILFITRGIEYQC